MPLLETPVPPSVTIWSENPELTREGQLEKPVRVYVADTEASERMGLAAQLAADADFEPRFGDELVASATTIETTVGDAEVLCVTLGGVSAAAIEAATDLRLILKCGSGVNNIDIATAQQRGIPVLHTRGANFASVAEYVIGAIIALNRRLVEFDRVVREGKWQETRQRWAGQLPALTGKVLGVVGVGSIGAEVARLGRAHGMQVLGCDPRLDPVAGAELGLELVSKEQLLERADVVSLHLALNEATAGFISEPELARMKPTALLVNTARGSVVDEKALARALASGQIAAAAIDVFEQEPLPRGSELAGLDNCLLSPHLSGCTDYGYAEIGEAAIELLRLFLEGRPLPSRAVVTAPPGLVVEPG